MWCFILQLLQSPLRYPGSKGKASIIKKIKPYIDEAAKTCKEYREPFVGGGSVFLNSSSFDSYWLNDYDPNIASLYNVMKNNPEGLCKKVLETVPDIEKWSKIKMSIPVDEMERAFRTLFLNRTNYSGILKAGPIGGHGQKSEYNVGCRWNAQQLTERIRIFSQKLQNVKITCKDFFFVINKLSAVKVFIFVDPPYYQKGNDLYERTMDISDHERLRDLLASTKHYFLLTYDNCPEVRELYGDISHLYFLETGWKYTTGKATTDKRKVGKEIFISNFAVPGLAMTKPLEYKVI